MIDLGELTNTQLVGLDAGFGGLREALSEEMTRRGLTPAVAPAPIPQSPPDPPDAPDPSSTGIHPPDQQQAPVNG